MFLLSEPSAALAESCIKEWRELPFSYKEVGATRGPAPAGYDVDHNRALLGQGEEAFRKAVAAVRAWQMFNTGWSRVYPAGAELSAGNTLAVAISHYGFWSLNPLRVVYLMDEGGRLRKYGFAYGTLPGHAETGEERFSVEWDTEAGGVWYDLFAFSRPGKVLPRLCYPLSRMLQRRFARDSKEAMVSAVAGIGPRT